MLMYIFFESTYTYFHTPKCYKKICISIYMRNLLRAHFFNRTRVRLHGKQYLLNNKLMVIIIFFKFNYISNGFILISFSFFFFEFIIFIFFSLYFYFVSLSFKSALHKKNKEKKNTCRYYAHTKKN